MENWKTVSQIAKETGITRQKIYRYVYSSMIDVDASERPKQADMIKQVGHTYYLSPDAEKTVIEHFQALHSNTDVNHHDASSVNHDTSPDEQQYDVIDALQARIDAQSREIDRLHMALEHAQTALEQAQTIQAQQQVLMLQQAQQDASKAQNTANTVQTQGTDSADREASTADPTPDAQEHKSIWSRLFKRG